MGSFWSSFMFSGSPPPLPKPKLVDLDAELAKKYSYYQKEVEDYEESRKWTDPLNTLGHELLNACASGCHFSQENTCDFTEHTLNDIRRIVELVPDSVLCDFGLVKCRNNITALYIACWNENIPLSTIQFLVEKGADPFKAVKINNKWAPIVEDILVTSCVRHTPGQKDRLEQIQIYFDTLGPFPE